jgi:DNA-binding NarL/FixJ family response regulator
MLAECTSSDPTSPIRALVVSPLRLITDGLLALTSSRSDIVIAGVAANVADAVGLLARCDAHVTMIDTALGHTAVRPLLAETRGSGTEPFILNAPDEPSDIVEYIEGGARGYATADKPFSRILDAIGALMRKEAVCSPRVMVSVFRRLAERSGRETPLDPGETALTHREAEILVLVAPGLVNKEIAEQLGIRIGTASRNTFITCSRSLACTGVGMRFGVPLEAVC